MKVSGLQRLLAVWLALVVGAACAQEPQLTLHGEVRRAQFMSYQEVPFDVPEGVSRLTVEFTYTGHDHGTNLDMGVIDPQRFRGWSGGNKHTFTVSESDATPSYLPGPVVAGRWRLLVGVPAIREGSVAQYTVKVWWQKVGTDAASGSTFSQKPIREGAAWYRGDLHMHTGHSDGSCASESGARIPCPVFLTAQAAVARGLDFIAITDHNTTSHYDAMRELQPYFDKLLLIPGREITTFYGHANVFGTTQFIDFRLGTKPVPTMKVLLDEVDAAHGLLALNHPGVPSGEQCMGCGWTAPNTDFARIHVMEAVNGADADGEKSGVPVWQQQLDRGLRITAIGGSDNHNALIKPGQNNAIGSPTTVVYSTSLSESAILAGIRAGHVFIDTDGTKGRSLILSAVSGNEHALMGDVMHVAADVTVTFTVEANDVAGMHGEVITDGKHSMLEGSIFAPGKQVRTFTFASDGKPHTVRVEIRDAAGKLKLLANPVYLNR
ncbi:CehA/McbA family metallohydrolase [Terriglobus roseus]|uniref:Predicted metal-dependent phosphoesterase TrpH, contains PHP domain n=1 Tax=Terriglobus roseus TaxID=392734 RepID=A0A1G7PSV0_9BACT|nr:CehA/McbA family metallohydrolase [Terriglobus roseus]SDF89397.1 Predicted metal-dependent phosphoesterase TrpH, contains PHP domain [Terriglobus roseus]